MTYGHGNLLALVGRCEQGWCTAPANGVKMDDGRRYCPEHALEVLRREAAEEAARAVTPPAPAGC